jgi:hypothetical protein
LYSRTAKAIESSKFITYTKAKRKALQERLYRYEFTPTATSGQVQVLNATGRLVMSLPLGTLEGKNTLPIDISPLPAGLYALKLVVEAETVVLPFVKQ